RAGASRHHAAVSQEEIERFAVWADKDLPETTDAAQAYRGTRRGRGRRSRRCWHCCGNRSRNRRRCRYWCCGRRNRRYRSRGRRRGGVGCGTARGDEEQGDCATTDEELSFHGFVLRGLRRTSAGSAPVRDMDTRGCYRGSKPS